MDLVLVTGSEAKAKQFADILGQPLETVMLDLDEIQSLDLTAILEHKARQAYEIVKRPLFVDDVSYAIDELNGFPGPLVKWVLKAVGTEGLCRLADITKTRRATITVSLGYCDERGFISFTGEAHGMVADHPRGTGGFGWDATIIQDGCDKTRAELNDEEYEKASVRKMALDSLKLFLRDRV